MTQIHFQVIRLSMGIQYELPCLSCRCSSDGPIFPIFSTVYLVYCICDILKLCDATATGLRPSSSSALQPWVGLGLVGLRQWYHDFSTRWHTTIYPYRGLCQSWNYVSWQINRKHWTCSVDAASFMSEVIRFWSTNSWGIFLHCLNLLWAASEVAYMVDPDVLQWIWESWL